MSDTPPTRRMNMIEAINDAMDVAMGRDADVVVFGHSHIPWDGVEDGVHLLNPGSVADPRREPSPSFAVLTVDAGTWGTEIVRFPRSGSR